MPQSSGAVDCVREDGGGGIEHCRQRQGCSQMSATRREWLGRMGRLSAAGWSGSLLPAPAVKSRRRASELAGSSTDLQLFTSVYKAWNGLKQNDPWSLASQQTIHAIMCAQSGPGGDVHASWNFLPWHRCFVHFHERVLIAVAQRNGILGAEN